MSNKTDINFSNKTDINFSNKTDINFSNSTDEIYFTLLTKIYDTFDNNIEYTNFRECSITKPKIVYDTKSKKSIWSNFGKNCKEINRTLLEIKNFTEKELTTTSSINQAEQLLIKGKYKPELLISNFKKYMNLYVQCHSCKSLSTELTKHKDFNLYTINCKKCRCVRNY
jgi:translation initiation factor 2 beta subunit (eIF-2beta)/eIF-5